MLTALPRLLPLVSLGLMTKSRFWDLLKNLNHNKEDYMLKGQALKNKKALWDRMLEKRILLQKVFSSSDKLPQEPLRSSFCSTHKVIDEAYKDLLASTKLTMDGCLKFQEVVIANNVASEQVSNNGIKRNFNEATNMSNGSHSGNDEDWLQIKTMQSRIVSFRDSSIDKWQGKTQMTIGEAAFKSKLRAFNQSVSQQVAINMRDPSRMIKRMQLRRSLMGVIGDVQEESNKITGEDASVDCGPELLDDSEFYQQLLKEFLESFNTDSRGNFQS